VGEFIVAELFPPGQSGRIPLVAVRGGAGDGPAAVARRIEELLRAAGRVPGLTCREGKWRGGWRCDSRRRDGVADGFDMLMAPDIDAAVFELDPQDVLRRGLPFDRLDALVVPPGTAEAADAVAAAELLARIVAPAGTIVVPADRPALREVAARSGRTIVACAGTPGEFAAAAVAAVAAPGLTDERIRSGFAANG